MLCLLTFKHYVFTFNEIFPVMVNLKENMNIYRLYIFQKYNLSVRSIVIKPIPSRGGAESAPPTTYFTVNSLKQIERPFNFLTFPKYGFRTDL